jgi:hypothetical protein
MKKLLIGITVVAVGLAFATSSSAIDLGREMKKAAKQGTAHATCNEYNKNIKKKNCKFVKGRNDQVTCNLNDIIGELQAAQVAIESATDRDVNVHITAYGPTYSDAKQRTNFVKNKLSVVSYWDYYPHPTTQKNNDRLEIQLKAN